MFPSEGKCPITVLLRYHQYQLTYFLVMLEENMEAKTYAMIVEVEGMWLNSPSLSQLRILSVTPNCL